MYAVPRRLCCFAITLILASTHSFTARAAGDAANGATIFAQCGACHSAEPGKTIVGPSLYGVIGRPAGSMTGFAYSEAMQDAAKKGLTWTPENVVQYLENPRKFLNDFSGGTPPNKMPFSLADPEERADVVAHLQTLGPH